MTPDQIAQLRQLLKEVLADFPKANYIEDCKKMRLLEQALALLPCPTCNGTSKKPRPKGQSHCRLLLCQDLNLSCGKCDFYIPCDPCPTCNGTGQCKDPKAGNSNMLTLMECPDCQPKPAQEESSPSTMWEHLH